MRLLLCDHGDPAAAWLRDGLAARGTPVELVWGHDLVAGARWEHRVADEGVSSVVALADGRVLDSAATTSVLNRLTGPPAAALGRVGDAERDYALGELRALWHSWLHALPRVLGRPVDGALCGPVLRRSQWALHAARAGLQVPPYRAAADVPRRVAMEPPEHAGSVPGGWLVVAGGRVVGPRVPPAVVDGCRALAAAVHADVLGIELDRSLRVLWATPVPDLRTGGAAVLDVLAGHLR